MNRPIAKINCLRNYLARPEENTCLLLQSGLSALDCRIELIKLAQEKIQVASFLWRNDTTGNYLLDLLEERAQEGVRVQILLDHWVLLQTQNSILPRLRELTKVESFEVKLFNPIVKKAQPTDSEVLFSGAKDFVTLHKRMHSKTMLFDDSCAIFGGRNIGDEYFDAHRFRCFSDVEVLIGGEPIGDSIAFFKEFWNAKLSVDLYEFKGESEPASEVAQEQSFLSLAEVKNLLDKHTPAYWESNFTPEKIQLVYDSADLEDEMPDRTGKAFEKMLERSPSLLKITTPILILPKNILKSLKRCTELAPSSTSSIVTNSLLSSDNLYTYAASLQQRKEILDSSGLLLHEIKAVPEDISELVPSYKSLEQMNRNAVSKPGSGFGSNKYESSDLHTTLHAKYFIVGDTEVVVGSMNLDPRSLYSNTEALLFIEDQSLHSTLTRHHDLLRMNTNSWIVAARGLRKRGLLSSVFSYFHRYGIVLKWPFKYTSCFEPVSGTQKETPNPLKSSFEKEYKAVGAYPGVHEAEEIVEMHFLKHLSTIFKELL